ncbi:MAG TPA: TAXI family TRAP transporter solute-binding subunit [Stellaceae bacterium]|nr:TAXI family TRAP transporter solute-binding subunit [Stellaceae bacterium]
MTKVLAILFSAALLFTAGEVPAKEQTKSIVIRAGKTDSPNHALAVQFAEAVAVALNGAYTLDVQESQGSIENVRDTLKAPRDYLFTTGPNVIAAARRGVKPFEPNTHYKRIRALFPIPAQTVQWVVRKDGDVKSLADLAGKSFISGAKGNIAERVTTEALETLGILHEVQIMDISAGAAAQALKAKQVAGFAIAGPYPLKEIIDLAATTPIGLLSMPQAQLHRVLRADDSIAAEPVPKSTYPGLDADVTALALPAGVYTTTRMSEDVAYAITKAFWTQRDAIVKKYPPWQAANAAALATLGAELHPGALRYYKEALIPVPRRVR